MYFKKFLYHLPVLILDDSNQSADRRAGTDKVNACAMPQIV